MFGNGGFGWLMALVLVESVGWGDCCGLSSGCWVWDWRFIGCS